MADIVLSLLSGCSCTAGQIFQHLLSRSSVREFDSDFLKLTIGTFMLGCLLSIVLEASTGKPLFLTASIAAVGYTAADATYRITNIVRRIRRRQVDMTIFDLETLDEIRNDIRIRRNINRD